MSTVFSRIISGEVPAARVYEDEQTLAFLDINPASRGHTLVICKEEYADLLSTPPEVAAAVARTAQRVARAIMETIKPDGFNILQNNGAAAGQVVFHYHVHIIPRWDGDQIIRFWRPGNADPAELQEMAARIRTQVS